jgi:hypothetical protein
MRFTLATVRTIEGNTISVYIHQLQRKLGDDFINIVLPRCCIVSPV